MKKLFRILLFLCFTLPVFAQVDYVEEKTKINSIKRNSAYLYGEGMAETAEEALDVAEANLRSEIVRFIYDDKNLEEAEAYLINSIKKNSGNVSLKRGTLERVFLYVKKENITPDRQTMVIDLRQEEEWAEAEPEEVFSPEEIIIPEEEQPVLLEEIEEETEEIIPEIISTPEYDRYEGIESETLRTILSITQTNKMETYIKEKKAERKLMWGNVTSDINPSWYLIFFTDNEVKAVFDKGTNTRKNLLTGERESISNYKNIKKIWFTLYE